MRLQNNEEYYKNVTFDAAVQKSGNISLQKN